MMLLPIVERELRVGARQWRTYWGRSMVGAVALLQVLYMIWVAGQLGGGAAAGPLLLKISSYLALCFCLFSGISRTADCLSSEKREDTLGLLFLTHLRAHDIVFGKLASASLHSLLFLIGTMPILSIPVMLGGVTGAEMLRVPVSLVNALLLSLAIGMLSSALLKVQRQAMLMASVLIVLLAAVLPGLGLLIHGKFDLPLVSVVMSMPSPIFANEMSLTGGFGLSRNLFWTSILVQFSISVISIVAACLILPHAWQVKSGDGARWKQRLRQWTLGTPEQRRERRVRLLARNPIFWLGARDRFGPLLPPFFMGAVLSIIAGLIVYYEISEEPAFVLIFMGLGITDFYFRARVATLSASLFARERQMGTWEMILSTPMTVREIITGNWMAVRHHLLRTYLFFLVVYPLTVWVAMAKLNAPDAGAWVALMFGLFSIGEFFVLGYVGMWRGMRAHSAIHAPGQALVRITVMPWFIWMLLLPVVMSAPPFREAFDSTAPYGFIVVSCVIWAVSSGLAFRRARRNLLDHFREPAEAPSLAKFVKAKLAWKGRSDPPAQIPLLRPIARNLNRS